MKIKKITIVLMPGLNGTDGLFKPLIDCTPNKYNTMSITYPTNKQMSYEQLVPYVLDKLKKIDGHYVLIGESFSGPLSIIISSQKPQGLIGTILVATFISAPNLKAGYYLPWLLSFKLLKPLYPLLSKQTKSTLINAISTELKKVLPTVLAHRIKSAFSVAADEALRNINVPLIYFRGKNDFLVPKRNIEKILSVRPDVKVVEFKAHHFILQTMPAEAWEAISSFIDEIVKLRLE